MNELETRLTQAFGIRHPIISAPMALAAGGRLAGAVSRAGGLGLIGGGYGDEAWLDDQFALETEGPAYRQAFMEGDPERTGVWFGEEAGLVASIKSAAEIVETIASEAAGIVRDCGGRHDWG